MIQLRKQDVRCEPDGWVIRLTPEAGGIKTNQFRDVPLHEHLAAVGFLSFVADAREGPLFCEAASDGSTSGPADGVKNPIRP
jgi:hypothetical protein